MYTTYAERRTESLLKLLKKIHCRAEFQSMVNKGKHMKHNYIRREREREKESVEV